MVLVFQPIHSGDAYLADFDDAVKPEFAPGESTFLRIGAVTFVPEYRAQVTVP